MIEYKDAQFYTEYFSSIPGFMLKEEFKSENEENLYVGYLEVLDTIHPLVLRVEIPFSFPHKKLTFRTKSLRGYPHLIHGGNVENGDWFCLNTPFAETPEEQLYLEIYRIKEWISRQMREDLPPIIDDRNVIRALAFANAYEWENPDEVKEFSSQALLSFVGSFHGDISYFKESLGYLHCIKTPDNRFYAIKDSSFANYKLPYIIGDQEPSSYEILSDFFKLKEQYGWDEKICNHLFPKLHLSQKWYIKRHSLLRDMEDNLALAKIEEVENELEKAESYLPAEIPDKKGVISFNGETRLTKVLPSQKQVLLSEIKVIKESIVKFGGYKSYYDKVNTVKFLIDEEQAEVEDYAENAPYKMHYFALGVKNNGGVEWNILFTQQKCGKYDAIMFDLKLKELFLHKLLSQPLHSLGVQLINQDMFFGRGAFSEKFRIKRVALVGLGAVGSMVANSLAHSGISKIGLWDIDVVEPGNICRSAYTINDLGKSKVESIASIIKSINPFIEASDICENGSWEYNLDDDRVFRSTSFYDNINYKNQEDAIKELDGYDLIIDCTGSNEMLHFLSYAASNIEIVSLCITNHAYDLLCITNRDGNPFELRKAYLSRIEQDTKNFYMEGAGCYSPTFFANNCDIAALVNLALKDLNQNLDNNQLMHSTIYSYSQRGVVADRISTYRLEGYDISLNVSSETLFDAEDIADAPDGDIGYIFGYYSKDGKQIMITHIVDALNAKDILTDVFATSKGLIDYIGDYRYSKENPDTYNQDSYDQIVAKAEDESINTNNPLLAVRNPDGSVTFFLYINGELVKFLLIS